MDARTQKLQRLGLSREDAQKLVEAGLDSPAKIRRANTKDLPKGVSAGVRKRFPKQAL